MGEFYQMPISVSIDKVLLAQRHSWVCTLVSDCFRDTTAGLSVWRDHLACKALSIYYLDLDGKSVLISSVDDAQSQ